MNNLLIQIVTNKNKNVQKNIKHKQKFIKYFYSTIYNHILKDI